MVSPQFSHSALFKCKPTFQPLTKLGFLDAVYTILRTTSFSILFPSSVYGNLLLWFNTASFFFEEFRLFICFSLPLYHCFSLHMLNHLKAMDPFCIDEDMLSFWLGMMPVTFALLYVGKTFRGLLDISHGWNEVSTTHWVFLLLGFGISVILMAYITKIAKASMGTELNKPSKTDKSLAPEIMLPLVACKELDVPEPLTITIDPLREDPERNMVVTCTA